MHAFFIFYFIFYFFPDTATTAAAISVLVCPFLFCYLRFQTMFPAVRGLDPRTSSLLLFIIFISLSRGCCSPHHKCGPLHHLPTSGRCSLFDLLIHSKASLCMSKMRRWWDPLSAISPAESSHLIFAAVLAGKFSCLYWKKGMESGQGIIKSIACPQANH